MRDASSFWPTWQGAEPDCWKPCEEVWRGSRQTMDHLRAFHFAELPGYDENERLRLVLGVFVAPAIGF